jgi:hypothetical protein
MNKKLRNIIAYIGFRRVLHHLADIADDFDLDIAKCIRVAEKTINNIEQRKYGDQ